MSNKPKKTTKYFEWQQNAANEKCDNCGLTGQVMSIDHIVPKHFIVQLGITEFDAMYNYDKNFRYLCRYCNQLKAGKIDVRHPKTFEVLRELLDIAEKEFNDYKELIIKCN